MRGLQRLVCCFCIVQAKQQNPLSPGSDACQKKSVLSALEWICNACFQSCERIAFYGRWHAVRAKELAIVADSQVPWELLTVIESTQGGIDNDNSRIAAYRRIDQCVIRLRHDNGRPVRAGNALSTLVATSCRRALVRQCRSGECSGLGLFVEEGSLTRSSRVAP